MSEKLHNKVPEEVYNYVRKLELHINKMNAAISDVCWVACVWNDHNFSDDTIRQKAKSAAQSLGLDRISGVDKFNAYQDQLDMDLASKPKLLLKD